MTSIGRLSGFAATLLAAGLIGCGGGRGGPSAGIASQDQGPAPVQLGGATAPRVSGRVSVKGRLDEALARRAIENYRLSKKRAKAPYTLVGADLNGDGVAEAVVLFQGKDWCTKTGCSMAVFQSFQHGFRPISRTVRVKAPVEVTDTTSNGYRDMLVQTGGGPAPERRVRLRFTGEGYARNAMLQPEVPLGSVVRTEIIIPVAASPAPQASARNP
jgi:putative lipoprotein